MARSICALALTLMLGCVMASPPGFKTESGVGAGPGRGLLQTSPPPYPPLYPPPYPSLYPPPLGWVGMAYPPPYPPSYPPPPAPPAPPPPFVPLPIDDINGAQSTSGSAFNLPFSIEFAFNTAGCAAAGSNQAEFLYMFAVTAANAWNQTPLCVNSDQGAKCVKIGDIRNIVLSGPCFSSSGRLRMRALLQGGGVNKAAANINMPPGVSATEATANKDTFKAACEAAYMSGMFAQSFGVTGATSAVEDPVYYDNGDNSSALALGLSLGLGIPLLVAIVAAIVTIHRRRRNQAVGRPSSPLANQDYDRLAAVKAYDQEAGVQAYNQDPANQAHNQDPADQAENQA